MAKEPRSKAYTLQRCAQSGLPLGYFPSRKIQYAQCIPFAALSPRDVRVAVDAACDADAGPSPERVFAFFALLHKIPPQLLEIRTAEVRPRWQHDARLTAILTNNGLANFLALTETLSSLSARLLEEFFPAYRICEDFAESTTSLREFPNILSRWISISTSDAELRRRTTCSKLFAAQEALPSIRALKNRGRNPLANIFAPTKTNSPEVGTYSRILADFYGRKHTPKWEDFVRNPSQASSLVLRNVIQNVIAHNISEADEASSDELEISLQFRRWLEEAHLQVQQQEEAVSRMSRVINSSVAMELASMSEVSFTQLTALNAQIDAASGKPQRENFPSLSTYLDALAAWRKRTLAS